MAQSRLTYYRLNDANQIEKIRRIKCPPGWTRNKNAVLLQQKQTRQREATTQRCEPQPAMKRKLQPLEKKTAVTVRSQQQQLEDLEKLIERLKHQNADLLAANKRLEELTSDEEIYRRKQKEKQERRFRENEQIRLRAGSTNRFSEQEYYEMKNQMQGYKERAEHFHLEWRKAHEHISKKQQEIMNLKKRLIDARQALGTVDAIARNIIEVARKLNNESVPPVRSQSGYLTHAALEARDQQLVEQVKIEKQLNRKSEKLSEISKSITKLVPWASYQE